MQILDKKVEKSRPNPGQYRKICWEPYVDTKNCAGKD